MKRLAILLLAFISAVQAQSVWINDEGVLREITGIFVNDEGTLRDIQSGWINDAGQLRQIFSKITLDAGSGGTVSQLDFISGYDTTVGIRFLASGAVQTGKEVNGGGISWSSAGNWIDPTSAADGTYSVRFTNFNGSGGGDWTTEATIDNAWIAISSTRTYLMNSTIAETINFTCDFEVRKTAGAPPATASDSYTFDIQNV